MSPFIHRACAASLTLAALGTAAHAQVTGTVLQYQSIYQQSGATPPTATFVHQFSAFMTVTPGGDFSVYEVQIVKPDGTAMTTSSSGSLFSTSFFTHPTRDSLMAAFPAGTYRFDITDGEMDEEPFTASYALQQPSAAGAWPNAIPAFTPDSVAALQGMDPAQPRTVTVNAFTVSPPANGQMNGLSINRRNADGTLGPGVWSSLTLVNPPTNSRTIPANTLQPNTSYYASWIFDQRIVPTPPPGVAYAQLSFGNITRFAFTTGAANQNPCPADLGVQGGLAGHDGTLDNNDFIAFISHFFNTNPAADLGRQGGLTGSDGQFDNNDFIAFITLFFAGCP